MVCCHFYLSAAVIAPNAVSYTHLRFDLLLGNETTGEVFPVGVKSCTLFGEKGAMFPDAGTARGKKHVDHLGQIGQIGRAGILILVQWLSLIHILSLKEGYRCREGFSY